MASLMSLIGTGPHTLMASLNELGRALDPSLNELGRALDPTH